MQIITLKNAEIRKFILSKNAEIRKFILSKNAEIHKFILQYMRKIVPDLKSRKKKLRIMCVLNYWRVHCGFLRKCFILSFSDDPQNKALISSSEIRHMEQNFLQKIKLHANVFILQQKQ